MAKTSTETYRTNSKSRAKHVKENSPRGKYAHDNAYKRAHAKARASLKIGKGSKMDAAHDKGSTTNGRAQHRSINRKSRLKVRK